MFNVLFPQVHLLNGRTFFNFFFFGIFSLHGKLLDVISIFKCQLYEYRNLYTCILKTLNGLILKIMKSRLQKFERDKWHGNHRVIKKVS